MDNESEKRRKFRELAERRTNFAIESVLRIGKLSNRNAYEFDEADVKKIVKALRDAISEIEDRFASPRRRLGGRFSL